MSSTSVINSEWELLTKQVYQTVDQHWYPLKTTARHEKRVWEYLGGRNIEAFLPLYREAHRWKDRTAHVDLPLFPGYLFVRLDIREKLRVLELPGVSSFVCFGAGPVSLPDSEIATLRLGVQALRAQPHPFLTIGDRVRVIAGPMRGAEGVLVRKKDMLRVVINVAGIMRAFAVEVDGSDVEIIRS